MSSGITKNRKVRCAVKKQLLWCIVSAVLISAVGSGTMTALHLEMTPELCADLCVAQNRLCGIDYQAKKQIYQIYQCSNEGTETVAISQKAEKHNRRYIYDKMLYDVATQQTYVHVSEFACDTGLIAQETVYQCDFQKQKLESSWEIMSGESDRTSAFAMTCMVLDGVLYYLTDNEEGDYQIYKQDGEIKTAVRSVSCSDSAIFSKFQFDADGVLYAFSTTGGLYREDSDGILQPVFGETDAWNSYANPAWGTTDITCLDLKNKQSVNYSLESGEVTRKPMTDSYTQTEISGQNGAICVLNADMLSNHCMLSDGGFAAYAELPEQLQDNDSRLQSGLVTYQNGNMTLYPKLSYSKRYLWRYAVIRFLLILGGVLLLSLLGFSVYVIMQKRHYISIRLEMTAFAILLFGSVIGVTSFAINNIMTDSFNDSYQKVFDSLEQEIRCELDTLILQTKGFSKEKLFSEDFHASLAQIMQNTSIRNPKTGEEEFAPYFLFHALNEDEELVVLYNSSGKEQIPTSYTYDNSYLTHEYQAVLTENKHQNLTQYDTEGTWNVQLCSYENPEYGVYAVVEIGIDQYLTDWKTRQITSSIIWFMVLMCSLMVVAVIIFLGFSFLPIRRLGLQVEQGSVEKPGKSRWSSETSAIWERLYVMIRNVKQRNDELETNNQQHYRFVSLELVQMLRLDELADALPGIRRKCSVHLVYAVFEKMELKQINQLYQELLPIIERHGGIICSMDKEHTVWLFKNDSGNPLAAADQIRQTALRKKIAYGVGVGSGTNTVFVRGTETCADIAVIGAEAELAEKLARLALKQNQCLLSDAASNLTDTLGWGKQCFHEQNNGICGYLLLNPVDIRNAQKIR